MTNYPKWARPLAAKMALEGVQQIDIAKHYGVSRQFISAVMMGRAKSEDAATAYINEAVNAIKAARAKR